MHVQIIKETMANLRELADGGCAVMLITHDIESVFSVADYVAVFYAGTTVEIAPATDFKADGQDLRHPYSKALWQALPANGFISSAGFQPSASSLPKGCLFEPRCSMATEICSVSRPQIRTLRGAKVRCFNAY
jgi:peptide/nickel transport system ATP-binding protein